MKKILMLVVILILVSMFSLGNTKVLPLDENIMKPEQIVVGDDYMYITEGTTISVFSVKDDKVITRFGKKGEGPGEIQGSRRGNVTLTLIPLKDKLYLFNRNKVMYFSKKGKFLKEIRIQGGFVRSLFPVGDKFVGQSFIRGKNRSMKTAINIFSNDLKTKKIFYGTEKEIQRGSFLKHFMPDNVFIMKTGNGKVYINDTDKLIIKVFEISGKKINEIKYNYKLQKVSERTKKDIRNYYKTSPRFKAFYDRIKNRIEIGNRYNAIKDFFVDKDTIYVQTHIKTDSGVEFLLFTKTGKFIKKTVLPLHSINVLEFYPYYIKNDTLYQIVENEDEEEWELHITKI